MAEARTQTSRAWLWIGAAVLLMAVFLAAKSLLRDRMPVRVAAIEREMLQNTVSTNGRVEPITNYQFYSPLATTVKAVYAQEGELVPKGKLILQLDDVAARAGGLRHSPSCFFPRGSTYTRRARECQRVRSARSGGVSVPRCREVQIYKKREENDWGQLRKQHKQPHEYCPGD